jgi:SAM-dependent methyltransferase
MRVLDIGCGPGSITAGLTGRVIGVDVRPSPISTTPVVGGDGAALPFAGSTFDAIYVNAVLQHVADATEVLREAGRVAKPGAVIGIGDADWGTRIVHPSHPLLDRGQEIHELARGAGNVRVGRELRGLLVAAGFERIELATEGRSVGSAHAAREMATFERAWFEAPEVVAYVTERHISDSREMAQIAAAWTRWSNDPGACAVDQWFTAIAWSPGR